MEQIAHIDIKDVAATAQGDFCFVTPYRASRPGTEHREGTDVRWAYSKKLKDCGGAEHFDPSYSLASEIYFEKYWR